MRVRIAIFLLLLSVSAEATTYGQKVAWPAGVSQFVVRLTYAAQGFETFCTGTLISNWEVLTAGHCLMGVLANPLKEGQLFIETHQGKRIQIVSANSRFQGSIDIAVAFLAEDVGFGPAEFPQLATAPCSKRKFLFSYGFGFDELGKKPKEPKVSLYWETEGNEDFLAAVSPDKSLGRNCFGDSGGPVFCELYERPVIASVNSRIAGGLVHFLRLLFNGISKTELCTEYDQIVGIRIHTQRPLISELRRK